MNNQGAFFGKGVRSHFKALQKSDDDILSAFSSFGEAETVSEEIIVQMERYICLLYANSPVKNLQGNSFENHISVHLRTIYKFIIPNLLNLYKT